MKDYRPTPMARLLGITAIAFAEAFAFLAY